MLTEARSANHSLTWASLSDEYCMLDHTGEQQESGFVRTVGSQSLASFPDSASMQKDALKHAWRLFFERAGSTSCSRQATDSLFPTLLDTSYLKSYRQRKEKLESELRVSFDAEPLEDGLDHPAEEIISRILQSKVQVRAFEWFRDFALDATHPVFAASILRCLGRQERPGTVTWRVEIVQTALAMSDVEMRDAAAQTAESWGGSDMRSVLQAHSEPEPWLQDYIQDIIEELTE